MRIVIDMQGWQASSRNRGIGRYTLSLVKEMLKSGTKYNFVLVFNGAFEDSITEFKKEFSTEETEFDLLNINVWYPVVPTRFLNSENKNNRKISEDLYQRYIKTLEPDFLLITSIFEGLIDEAVTYIDGDENYITGVILYDLIPMIYPDLYLSNETLSGWYNSKASYLKNCQYLFSISESAASEAIKYLEWDPAFVSNISTAADDKFKPIVIEDNIKLEIFNKFKINSEFLMYTGGWDHRKNIETLIESYSLLSKETRDSHQLVIVCSIPDENKVKLFSLAKSKGLTENQLILTGYVSDNDLLSLYNLCHAFIFPSWHEGFGLPVLEAMLCGKPVIASNVSSLPEVLEYEAALFDPKDTRDISEKILKVLKDESFRSELLSHSVEQVKKFSWKITAERLLNSISNAVDKKEIKAEKKSIENIEFKKKMAFFSPMPPEKSGISYYSEELLPYLKKYYDIDIINSDPDVYEQKEISGCSVKTTEYFLDKFNQYERVLYQVGNSHFHAHMFELIKSHPGVAVLHDFFMSGGVNWLTSQSQIEKSGSFNDYLYESHGYSAVAFNNLEINDGNAIDRYPCNYPILNNALSVIFHSNYARSLSSQWYNNFPREKLNHVPLLRIPAKDVDKISAREELKIRDNEILIISMGYIAPTKLNHRIINAFNQVASQVENVKLVFVGHNPDSDYGRKISSMIASSPFSKSIIITEWVSDVDYKKWLAAADIGIQLRTMSRGETSAAILDCMNFGLATIANSNGSMSELDPHAVKLLDDDFSDTDLKNALKSFVISDNERSIFGNNARECILEKHSPEHCAEQYYKFIEKSYKCSNNESLLFNQCDRLHLLSDEYLNKASQALADTFLSEMPHKIYIDVTSFLSSQEASNLRAFLTDLQHGLPEKLHIEPVHYDGNAKRFVFSQALTSNILSLNGMNIADDIVDFFCQSAVISYNPSVEHINNSLLHYQRCALNNKILFVFHYNDFKNQYNEVEIDEINDAYTFISSSQVIILDPPHGVENDFAMNQHGRQLFPDMKVMSTMEFINYLINDVC